MSSPTWEKIEYPISPFKIQKSQNHSNSCNIINPTSFQSSEFTQQISDSLSNKNSTSKQITSSTITPSPILEIPKFNIHVYDKSIKKLETSNKFIKYLSPKIEESFIGPILPTFKESINLIKSQCNSLSNIPLNEISLNLKFDDDDLEFKDIQFKILPNCWPESINSNLSLIIININKTNKIEINDINEPFKDKSDVKKTSSSNNQINGKDNDNDELRWDDLKENQQTLGIEGYKEIQKLKNESKIQVQKELRDINDDNKQKKFDPKFDFDFNKYSFDGLL
ncbi:uncharacterized protein I206_106478 [Kwoniella pini CBS 10737]|uniref:Uncharacterized protein n=1 Tax=Kwoniella pini CBS 10737 TaxID=1296096 RepID=A0A1B9HUE6_9TREE|nr:uncharacterized protein I206_07283 [Kwoniella pini CBS 10737]OCF46896.1 hypothetical protein I206_07283 [Kwoniella pini CBS 10737]